MVRKILKVVLDAVLTVVVLFVTIILLDWVASLIPGTSSKAADGTTTLSGVATIIMLIVGFAVAIGFAAWFYGFLNRRNNRQIG